MNPYTIVKVNFLIIALFLVIMAMSSLRTGGLNQGINALFGLGAETTSSPASR